MGFEERRRICIGELHEILESQMKPNKRHAMQLCIRTARSSAREH